MNGLCMDTNPTPFFFLICEGFFLPNPQYLELFEVSLLGINSAAGSQELWVVRAGVEKGDAVVHGSGSRRIPADVLAVGMIHRSPTCFCSLNCKFQAMLIFF